MTDTDVTEVPVQVQDVKNLIKMVGYEIVEDKGELFVVVDEDGVRIFCMVQGNVLSNNVPCTVVSNDKLSTDLLATMLNTDNGISTSSFRLRDAGENKSQIVLTNFCKLQALGDDDADDIRFALNCLEIDVRKARGLLQDLL